MNPDITTLHAMAAVLDNLDCSDRDEVAETVVLLADGLRTMASEIQLTEKAAEEEAPVAVTPAHWCATCKWVHTEPEPDPDDETW